MDFAEFCMWVVAGMFLFGAVVTCLGQLVPWLMFRFGEKLGGRLKVNFGEDDGSKDE